MAEPVPCFWLEPTGEHRVSLRRFKFGADGARCPIVDGYHTASSEPIDRVPSTLEREAGDDRLLDVTASRYPAPPHDDQRWPTCCSTCAYVFTDQDEWQVNATPIYRRVDTGEELLLADAPAGAMWEVWWMPAWGRGHDGRAIAVRLPNGRDWQPDSQASNCTRPGEEHDCWCRHGDPPALTVDKTPEPGRSTCAAGAGSIASGDGDNHWHGFLRDGHLVVC